MEPTTVEGAVLKVNSVEAVYPDGANPCDSDGLSYNRPLIKYFYNLPGPSLEQTINSSYLTSARDGPCLGRILKLLQSEFPKINSFLFDHFIAIKIDRWPNKAKLIECGRPLLILLHSVEQAQ